MGDGSYEDEVPVAGVGMERVGSRGGGVVGRLDSLKCQTLVVAAKMSQSVFVRA